MNRCKQCGAILPEGSTICTQCGTDNAVRETTPNESAPTQELEFLGPSIKGGLGLGMLAGIPLISCLCCIWGLGGGGLATWLLNKQRPGKLNYGDGALVGAVTGVIGGIVGTVVGIPLQRLLMSPETVIAMMERFIPNLPPEARENIMRSMGELNVSTILIGAVVNIVLYGLLALAGGCLTVAILNRQKND